MLKSLLKNLLFLINIIFATGMLLSYSAPYVSPEIFWPLQLVGLAYPFWFWANVFFAFLWIFRLNLKALLSVSVLLIGWNSIGKYVQIKLSRESPPPHAVKIMSYNVRLFDLYNWSNNTSTRNKIFDMLVKQNPDIICFQEFFYSEKKGYFTTLDTLVKFQKAKNVHAEHTNLKNGFHYFGKATFSAFPIVNKDIIDFKNQDFNTCLITDIKIGKDTVRIFNAHLASVHFQKNDYEFLNKAISLNTEQQMEGTKNILKRLKKGWILRAEQAEMIAEAIKQSPYPVIVCGDFNDSFNSYCYRVISEGLTDSFMESGNGFDISYNGTWPAFRIDYILHDDRIKTYKFETVKEKLSDHYPITCYFEIVK
ncbi:MAG: hypothetical protein D6707_07050 [Bacteroidetes bacterium]|nr:MAG: hypothetical protein D6707_07050 [Bacteroidota bacterium]